MSSWAAAPPELARTPDELIDQVLYFVDRLPSREAEDALNILFEKGTEVTVTQKHRTWIRQLRPFARNRTATFPTILINPRTRILDVFVNPIEGSEWMRTLYLASARLLDTRTGARLNLQIHCREYQNVFGRVLPDLGACRLRELSDAAAR